MRSPLHPTVEDLQAFATSTMVVSLCFWAYKDLTYSTIPYITLISGLVIISREIGQRTVAQWMDAYIDLKTTLNGSATSLFGASLSIITGLPIILLFPLTSSFSGKKYEHWGKSIDAIWAKRQYWLATSGLTTLFTAWIIAYHYSFQLFAELSALFIFFQLMPFDFEAIPTGRLDGAYILLWSGFTWLIMMGTALVILTLTFY